MIIALAFFLPAVCSYGLGFLVLRQLIRYRMIDRPNERSSHSQPTARGGGIAIVLVVLAGGAGLALNSRDWSLAGVLSVATVVAAVSWLDDIRSLPAALRLACHIGAAVAVSAMFRWPLGTAMPVPAVLCWLGLLVWLAGYTNAFNFMDGINGIAAGQAVITGLGMGVLGGVASGQWESTPVILSFVVAGASAGFLPHNFPKARMFMGDVGSASLGFTLGVLTLWIAHDVGWWLIVPLALLHSNFVLDTGITLIRRALAGKEWHAAHREHFYQRLVRAGKSHCFVTSLEMLLQLFVGVMLVAYLDAGLLVRAGIVAGVFVTWFLYFLYCERLFRKVLPAAVMS